MAEPGTASRLFGTDGIRGAVGRYPLDRPTVVALGQHLARRLAADGGSPPTVVMGGDTRSSRVELCRWLTTGLEAGGAHCRYLGVLPTPALAFLVRELGADAAIAVSASHNPLPDNGIKLIGGDGFKWAPEAEAELEEALHANADLALPVADVDLSSEDSFAAPYLRALAASLPAEVDGGEPLHGLRLAVDAANGAASALAARLYRQLGAEVFSIHASPDGHNINLDCGSTHPEELARLTRDRGCHLGVAFDGDADRAVFADEQGRIVDGDAVLYLWASALHATGRLTPPAIVATSMSNLGLERALGQQGIALERCDVGDREVVRTLQREGISLGGEQSGHIIHLGLATTGDGLLTGLQIASLCHLAHEPLSALLAGFKRYPQILLNVPVRRKPDWTTLPAVVAAAEQVEAELGDDGRLVLRYSGTESLARIMIEGPDQQQINAMAEGIAAAFRLELGE